MLERVREMREREKKLELIQASRVSVFDSGLRLKKNDREHKRKQFPKLTAKTREKYEKEWAEEDAEEARKRRKVQEDKEQAEEELYQKFKSEMAEKLRLRIDRVLEKPGDRVTGVFEIGNYYDGAYDYLPVDHKFFLRVLKHVLDEINATDEDEQVMYVKNGNYSTVILAIVPKGKRDVNEFMLC